jgi:flavin-dependent thymidylate synthase
MTNMSRRNSGQDNVAPGQEGRIDIGYENLKVKCIQWPEEQSTMYLLSKASVAVKGSIVEDEDTDREMAKDMFKGGLNQALEWVKLTFECSGVSRGLTHQLVRTRKASFAQQSMRYADMGSINVRMPEEIHYRDHFPLDHDSIDQDKYPLLFDLFSAGDQYEVSPRDIWYVSTQVAAEAYQWLAEHDVPLQDARTVCPIATETYILCNYDLAEFLKLYSYRACQMFYPEMVQIMKLMKESLLEKASWLEPYIKISCENTSGGISVDTGIGSYPLPHKCTYQGFEKVEGHCTFEWALEDNRIFKSSKVKA